jgi:hypothetical protein
MSVQQINNALSVVTMQLDTVDKVRQKIDQVSNVIFVVVKFGFNYLFSLNLSATTSQRHVRAQISIGHYANW